MKNIKKLNQRMLRMNLKTKYCRINLQLKRNTDSVDFLFSGAEGFATFLTGMCTFVRFFSIVSVFIGAFHNQKLYSIVFKGVWSTFYQSYFNEVVEISQNVNYFFPGSGMHIFVRRAKDSPTFPID